VHVNGLPDAYAGGKPFPKVHLPTGRLGIEDVIEFLIRDGGVEPVSDEWETTLREAREIFDGILARR
jgi:hypothetical protein